MNRNVNQNNLYLLIPSKASWVASMLIEDTGSSIVDAIKEIYVSQMYKSLEREDSKFWHLGPVALYQALQEGKQLGTK